MVAELIMCGVRILKVDGKRIILFLSVPYHAMYIAMQVKSKRKYSSYYNILYSYSVVVTYHIIPN